MRPEQLVLASSSPRRQEILRGLGLAFTVDPADIDETPHKTELPKPYVCRLAIEKAHAVQARHPKLHVLAADTTVAVGRRILGKPESADEAVEMITLMAGRRHRVHTAVALATPEGTKVKCTTTLVQVRPLTKRDIERYAANPDNWRGVAGAYGLQKPVGGGLVKAVNGSVSGVVGLPIVETIALLKGAGHDV